MSIKTELITKLLEYLEDEVDIMALSNSSGEYYRNDMSDHFIDGDTVILDLFLDETQGNEDEIISIQSWGFGATSTPSSGTETTTHNVTLAKTSGETMTISLELRLLEVD